MNFSEYVEENKLVLNDVRVDINELISFLQENENITQLSLRHCDIGKEGAKALANGNLTNLTELILCYSMIGNEGAKALANGNLTNLTSLNLVHSSIGNEGAKALANGNLTNLTSLNLGYSDVGKEGAEALANGNLINLTKLYLWGSIALFTIIRTDHNMLLLYHSHKRISYPIRTIARSAIILIKKN